jgi:hypothetical protein
MYSDMSRRTMAAESVPEPPPNCESASALASSVFLEFYFG